MSKPMFVLAEGRSSTDCPSAAATAGADLAAALLADDTLPAPAPGRLILDDVGGPVGFRPERAHDLDPAGLKWGGPTGRKDEG